MLANLALRFEFLAWKSLSAVGNLGSHLQVTLANKRPYLVDVGAIDPIVINRNSIFLEETKFTERILFI